MQNLKPKIYNEKIFYYEGIVDNPSELIQTLEDTDNQLSDTTLISSWHDWKSSNSDHQFGYRKHTNPDSVETNDDVSAAYNTLKNALDLVGDHYSETLQIPKGTQAPISISKYLPNEYMGPHADEGDPRAHFSAVLYLNDNFEDGGLEFPNQGAFIKPSAGSIIVFPSWQPFVHDPKPANNVKYISPAFWFVENSPLKSV